MKIYRNVNLVDVNDKKIKEHMDILVVDGKIKDLGDNLDYQADIVDLSGKFVSPGLINCHVHVTMDPVGDPFKLLMEESDSKAALRGARNLKKHLKHGTTYLRDVGARGSVDMDLRDFVANGLIQGPEMKVAGQVVTMTGGHGWPIGREADGVDEIRKAAREQLKAGADIVKIMATGGVMTSGVEPGSPQLSLEEMKAGVEEAHKAGRKTASHAQGTLGIKNAILAGIDSIEHGIILDEEVISLMLEKGTYLVPTLVAPYFIVEAGTEAGIKPDAYKKAKDMLEIHKNSFQAAYKAGVKIAMGTDAGTPYNGHDMAWYELKMMVDYGMSPMESIITATKNAADLLDIDDNYGSLEVDKYADFLVLNENPLENIEAFKDIYSVYKKGELVNL